jgi:hypothetical protein
MTVVCKVGSVNAPPQTSVGIGYTGIGFPVKALLLFGNAQLSDGVSRGATQNSNMPLTVLGMGVSSSAYSCNYSTDDFSTGDSASDQGTIYRAQIPGNGWTGTLVSLDADGFTIAWTVTGPFISPAPVINYMALGGSSLQASIVKWTTPTTAGNKGFTGAGFPPECLINIGGSGVVGQCLGFGMTDGVNQVANSSSYGGNVGRYQRTNKCYTEIYSGAVRVEANLVTLDSDGATFNFTTTPGLADFITTLCLRSGQGFKVGAFSIAPVTGNQPITGTGFPPVGLLLSSFAKPPGTTVDATRIVLNTSATDGVGRGSVMLGDGSSGVAAMSRARMIDLYNDNATPTVLAQGDIVSMDSNGFTYNISATDGITAAEVVWLAVGNVVAGSGPALLGQPPASHSVFGPF